MPPAVQAEKPGIRYFRLVFSFSPSVKVSSASRASGPSGYRASHGSRRNCSPEAIGSDPVEVLRECHAQPLAEFSQRHPAPFLSAKHWCKPFRSLDETFVERAIGTVKKHEPANISNPGMYLCSCNATRYSRSRDSGVRRLEALVGDRKGQHSIRINDQYRICFVWTAAGPRDVQIVDYH